MNPQLSNFWNLPADQVLVKVQSTPQGLSSEDAKQRLTQYGANSLKQKQQSHTLTLLLNQFNSPIILILIFAAILSSFLKDTIDAVIILVIVLASGLLGFWQERGAADAVQKLLEMVEIKASILRDGQAQDVPVDEVMPGDIVLLSAGRSIPGDCLILESQTLSVDEATLTGETYPVAKEPGVLPGETGLGQRTNSLFMGTHIVSGNATAVVVNTGKATEFGKVSERLKFRPPETEFESGVRKFGYFLLEVTLTLVILIFAANIYLQRPVLDSFMFSLALAVGLTPQLLPAIISINLAHGAKLMAKKQVIVKRLPAIENFGSMNVLCADKTGTLTDGVVRIRSALNLDGKESDRILFYAYLNAISESGYVNPIDEAIRNHKSFDISKYKKLDEIPYDFNRKRLSILFSKDQDHLVITKGAISNILDICTTVEMAENQVIDIAPIRQQIQQKYEDLGSQGFRTLGVAYRTLNTNHITLKDEINFTFLGYLALYDPPRSDIKTTITDLANLGVTLKMITGDSHAVAASISQQVGLLQTKLLTKAGRTTFANTLKYVFMATSANFGNMFSMAGVSLMLPFLPLLPKQILLTNLLTDFPEMTIAADRVDQELVSKPRRWDIHFISKFMLVFGLLSSVFDYLTFGALLFLLHADSAQFRTGWFMESVISASMIVLVIRTRQSIFHSKPSPYLFSATMAIALITLIIPYTPLASVLGFQALPFSFVLILMAIIALYVTSAEIMKSIFYGWVKF
ncbi:MAG: HAD-IC family P-type ATPase [Aphanizomenon flos-aquae Clear-A1]|jgi:Mg2+-importing ATPase|nr:HAD-IC family P-type ATPase [Aphanizomenon flos-aquae Clear-A1]